MPLDRLRRLTRDELRWRTSVALRTQAERLAARIRPPRWDRARLATVLAPHALDAEMRAAIAAQRWGAAHDALAARLRARPSRFVLDPASAGRLRHTVLERWPDAAADAARRADAILEGRHDLLGYRGLSFSPGGDIDWHFDPVHGRRAPHVFYADVPYLDPALGDHKIIWEINRHQHWLRLGRAAWLSGDPRYARAITGDLDRWLTANPPLTGINWASMLEIGFRALSWTWALHCLLNSEPGTRNAGTNPEPRTRTRNPEPGTRNPWLVDMLVGLDRQLTHVERHLSYYFSPNTHLTGEALALYVVGTALPELAESSRWVETGRRILLDQIDRQILPDGGHAERSTHYQRYTLDFYLLATMTARIATAHPGGPEGPPLGNDTARIATAQAGGPAHTHGDEEMPDEAVRRFGDAALRLAEFTRTMADDEGRLPLIGDDDGGMLWPLRGRECRDVRDSLSLAASIFERPDLAPWGLTEESLWIGGSDAADRHPPSGLPGGTDPVRPAAIGSRALPFTGYFVARDGRGGHAVFDAGAHGYMNGGHAHADALSMALTLANRPLLVDPGTSTYTVDPTVRDRMRRSMNHNTVTIDGRSQSMPAGPFQWQTRADARMHDWRHNAAFDWLEASHDGYAPVRHRRSLLRIGQAGWLVADEILGSGRHAAAAHWHFDPAWMLTCEPGRLRAAHAMGGIAWLLHDAGAASLAHGDERSGLGWYAPTYGTLMPTWSACVAVEDEAPFAVLTWIGEGDATAPPPVLERLSAACDARAPVIATRVSAGDRSSIVMLRPGEPAARADRACRLPDYDTDARALHYASAGETLLALDLVDARTVAAARDGWVSIDADMPIADLHVGLESGALDLRASVPPPRLRLRSTRTVYTVRLNGRDLPIAAARADAALLIHGDDWGAPDPARTRPAHPWLDSGAAFAQH